MFICPVETVLLMVEILYDLIVAVQNIQNPRISGSVACIYIYIYVYVYTYLSRISYRPCHHQYPYPASVLMGACLGFRDALGAGAGAGAT